ncbi:magnesium transporter [Ignatzschineria rhizosphaerae]|uniref:Magnesium transporter MgtE n=1 Tax=Ignatzschineria rhizosphaerae TaxID=2923279 RepID=A0ABY3WXS8_9GAMM|nr:magnesium transporter [Ignatzschineria rhizosphaerae]UNM95424.1 magnesium transporter [Ignatzschineria rhizosphaerae]
MVIQDRNMKFGLETAGSLMTNDFITLDMHQTVDEAIHYLRQNLYQREDIHYVYILDENKILVGVVAIRELLSAKGDEAISKVMKTKLKQVTTSIDQEEVAQLFQQTELVTIPVVAESGHLLGVIHIDQILDVMEQEGTEDIYRMASIKSDELENQNILTATIGLLYRKRIAWLVVLVFMNVFSGAGIATYEDLIESNVALVFFLPLLVDSGGNAGAQSATLVIRAMALGEVRMRDWFKMISKETLVSALLGFTMALAVSLVGMYRGGMEIAFIVALTMVFVVMIGSLIGLSLPFIFSKLKMDPATASGPLITSICDIVGVFIYFGIASAFITL